MKISIKYIVGLVFLLIAGSGFAQEVKVSASLDTMVMPIGEQQKMHLELIQPKSLNIQFPVYSDTIIDKVEILEHQVMDTVVLEDNRIRISHDYLITSFDSGFYAIPPAQFLVQTKDGQGVIASDPLFMKVITFEVDTTKSIFDIKGPVEVPYLFEEVLPYIIGGILIILLIAAVYLTIRYFTKKKKGEPLFETPKPVEPPHVVALRELEKLKGEKLWQKDQSKQYYTRLTDTLRVYMEGRFNIQAMEQTSHEIMEAMRKTDLETPSVLNNLRQILSIADLVKFAKQKPLPNENDLCMVNARLFVEQTKEIEVPETEELIKELEDKKASDENSTTIK